jgi:hypothetical protein
MVRWSALITIRAVSVIALIAGHEFTEERSVYDDESGLHVDLRSGDSTRIHF